MDDWPTMPTTLKSSELLFFWSLGPQYLFDFLILLSFPFIIIFFLASLIPFLLYVSIQSVSSQIEKLLSIFVVF